MDFSSVQTLINTFDDPVFVIDRNREILKINPVVREIFGEGLVGFDLARAFRHPLALQHVEKVLNKGPVELSSEPSGYVEFQHAADVSIDFRLRSGFAFQDESGTPCYWVILKDVSHVMEAEQMRSDFVANVSHELRSPLTAISGFIETLQGAASEDAKARGRFLEIMEREANRMNRIIDDLLTLSKVELDARVRPTSTADLQSVVAKVASTLQQQATTSGKQIIVLKSELDCTVNADEDQLVQIVQNLIENAIKYGASGTNITVSFSEADRVAGVRGRAFSFTVEDKGEGIEPEHIPRLTERFYRVDSGRSREKGGTGLGLAIVKHIVNRHRGKLTVESQQGIGSRFTVYIPAAG